MNDSFVFVIVFVFVFFSVSLVHKDKPRTAAAEFQSPAVTPRPGSKKAQGQCCHHCAFSMLAHSCLRGSHFP